MRPTDKFETLVYVPVGLPRGVDGLLTEHIYIPVQEAWEGLEYEMLCEAGRWDELRSERETY